MEINLLQGKPVLHLDESDEVLGKLFNIKFVTMPRWAHVMRPVMRRIFITGDGYEAKEWNGRVYIFQVNAQSGPFHGNSDQGKTTEKS